MYVSQNIIPFLRENQKKQDKNKALKEELVSLREENNKLKINFELLQHKASVLEKELEMLRSYMKHYSKIIIK